MTEPDDADGPSSSTAGRAPAGDVEMAPGGPGAVARGCLCSVLANAAFRARAEVEPFVDPRCPVHLDGARS